MAMEKVITGMFYIALGAFVAYLGFWWSEAGPHIRLLPALFAVGMGATGLALLFGRKARTVYQEADPERDSPWETRAEAAVSAAARSAAERNEDAALLGHEMKNYLCTLKGNAHLLRQRINGHDQIIIDRIDRVVEKLESFTRNMSEAHNATSSRVFWGLRLADSARACVVTHFHKEAGRFHWDVQDGGALLLGDPNRLEQVFLNLYANALEAGASSVITSVSRVAGRLELRIEDDGRGCAPEDVARIFEPFFTTKQGPARRGLGMFIVQSIVENHGGRVQVRSKNDAEKGSRGLVFTLDFPMAIPGFPEKPATTFPPEDSAGVSAHWLLALPEPF
ncbi:MAG TPA: HAMP domain-containing sensor histidine kinase [Fibrobacteria bacterium]|nr:HAMP domain-containing sensor histidine kinase [Fibrobacteria bacterium]